MTPQAVLVTDGQLRPALAVVRSLARAGYRVYVCSTRRHSLAGASRYAVDETQVPDPLSEPDAFVHAVIGLTQQWNIALLMPISEEALLVLLPAADRMQRVLIPFPPVETFRKAADKRYVIELAETLGISVPEQVVVRDRQAIGHLDFASLPFPVVIKPARSVVGEGTQRTKLGVTYAANPDELEALLAAIPEEAFPILLQRRIEGPGTGVFLLVWKSRLVAQFAHRRIREKPPSGGVSVCAESIVADPHLVDQSEALLAAIGWWGPAMVEFKEERATGRHYLMEINGRFWGSLQLAIDAGVDFPALLAGAALGTQTKPVTSYRIGVRSRWWWGEVDHLLAQLRGRGDAAGFGGRAKALWRFLQPGSHVRNEVLHLDDPWPFVRETIEWFRGR